MRLVLPILVGLLALAPVSGQERLQIVASIPDLANLVEEIGADAVDVEELVKPGQDPHLVLAKASLLLKLKRADGLLFMGLDYEHAFLPALLEKTRNRAVRPGGAGHMNVGARVSPLGVPDKLDRGQGADLHPRGNPHYNLDPENGRIMAAAARDLLVALDPARKASYEERWSAWDAEARQRIEEWDELMAPHAGRSLVAYHDSWKYFAQRYSLKELGFVEPKPGLSPTAKHLLALERKMMAENVHFILMEPWYSERAVAGVLEDTDSHVLKLAATSGGTKSTVRYLDWMDHVVRSIAKELSVRE